MLDQADAALDYRFGHGVSRCIVFNRILTGRCTNGMFRRIEEVPLRRFHFTDRPVGIADILFAGELTFGVCVIHIDKLPALVDPVFSACQRGVALRCSGFCVRLGYGHGKLFEDIGKAALCNPVPLDRYRLGIRDNVTNGRIDLLDGIWAANQDIAELSHAGGVRYRILIDVQAGKGFAVQAKLYALNESVFRSLGHLQCTAFEHVVEGHGRGLPTDNGDLL